MHTGHRQTDRQTDRHTHTHTHSLRCKKGRPTRRTGLCWELRCQMPWGSHRSLLQCQNSRRCLRKQGTDAHTGVRASAHTCTHAHARTHTHVHAHTIRRTGTRSLSHTDKSAFHRTRKTSARVHTHRQGRSSVLVSGVITGSTADLQGKSAADAVNWYLCV